MVLQPGSQQDTTTFNILDGRSFLASTMQSDSPTAHFTFKTDILFGRLGIHEEIALLSSNPQTTLGGTRTRCG